MDLSISPTLFTNLNVYIFLNGSLVPRYIHTIDKSVRWGHNHMKGAKENLEHHKASSIRFRQEKRFHYQASLKLSTAVSVNHKQKPLNS